MRSSWSWLPTVSLVLFSALPVVVRSSIFFRKKDEGQNRIIGGNEVSAEEYPFFVRLTMYGQLTCGGSLIHPEWVLTAAHCQNSGLVAYIGADNYSEGIPIAEAFVHQDYSDLGNDYMLLRLSQPVTNVAPVLLNTDPSHPSPGGDVTAIGMGVTEPGASMVSNTLQKVTLQAIDFETCQGDYDSLRWTIMDSSMLCAGSVTGKDTCSGDSGGPLLDEAGLLVGLTSFGYGCADPNYPGVYARVSTIDTWRKNIMCAHSTVQREGLCPTERRQPEPLAPSDFSFLRANRGQDENCMDALSDTTFFVNGDLGFRTCQWLSQAPEYNSELCVDGSDAFKVCLRTCRRCRRCREVDPLTMACI